jgi:hypothetical protein
VSALVKNEQFLNIQFFNDKIDQNSNFATLPKTSKWLFLCTTLKVFLQIALVFAKADVLVIIESA